MPETDKDRMDRLELDPRMGRWVQEIKEVTERVTDAMSRLSLLENEISLYRREPQ